MAGSSLSPLTHVKAGLTRATREARIDVKPIDRPITLGRKVTVKATA